jgi:2,4-dienoyl-CoA reductase-like NADH-dependent reductase (Old Yellow Enzyme family)
MIYKINLSSQNTMVINIVISRRKNVMSSDSPMPLLQPVALRHLSLPNRVVMAPLTRMRAANPEQVPHAVHADYYSQRASAGLSVKESS